MGVLGDFLERGLLLEPGHEGADETHVAHIITEGDLFHLAAAALAAVILASGRVDQVKMGSGQGECGCQESKSLILLLTTGF